MVHFALQSFGVEESKFKINVVLRLGMREYVHSESRKANLKSMLFCDWE